jgi:hypothetical protein
MEIEDRLSLLRTARLKLYQSEGLSKQEVDQTLADVLDFLAELIVNLDNRFGRPAIKGGQDGRQ